MPDSTTTDPTSANPLNTPWRADFDFERVIVDADGDLIGTMNTPEQAEAAAEAVSAGDVDARREVTRLTALMGHYGHRMKMTPSERQSILNEDGDQAVEPERWYIVNVEKPGQALRKSVSDALALLDADPATKRHPARQVLHDALVAYARDTPRWL